MEYQSVYSFMSEVFSRTGVSTRKDAFEVTELLLHAMIAPLALLGAARKGVEMLGARFDYDHYFVSMEPCWLRCLTLPICRQWLTFYPTLRQLESNWLNRCWRAAASRQSTSHRRQPSTRVTLSQQKQVDPKRLAPKSYARRCACTHNSRTVLQPRDRFMRFW